MDAEADAVGGPDTFAFKTFGFPAVSAEIELVLKHVHVRQPEVFDTGWRERGGNRHRKAGDRVHDSKEQGSESGGFPHLIVFLAVDFGFQADVGNITEVVGQGRNNGLYHAQHAGGVGIYIAVKRRGGYDEFAGALGILAVDIQTQFVLFQKIVRFSCRVEPKGRSPGRKGLLRMAQAATNQ